MTSCWETVKNCFMIFVRCLSPSQPSSLLNVLNGLIKLWKWMQGGREKKKRKWMQSMFPLLVSCKYWRSVLCWGSTAWISCDCLIFDVLTLMLFCNCQNESHTLVQEQAHIVNGTVRKLIFLFSNLAFQSVCLIPVLCS